MGTPIFSLVYITNKPGGFDLLVESLKTQPSDLYELIVVDNWGDRPQRGTVPEYISRNKIPLRAYTTPSLPPGAKNETGVARAYNTGIVWTTTNNVVIMQDLSWFYPGWAKDWMVSFSSHEENAMICGTASLRIANSPFDYGDITLWPGEMPCWHLIGPEIELWTPHFFEMMHTRFPIRFFEQVNGFDERKSSEAMGEVMFAQAQRLGYEKYVDKKIRIGMIDHKQWGGIWDTRYDRKTTPEPEVDILPVSPNPYCLKDIRDDLIGKSWHGAVGF